MKILLSILLAAVGLASANSGDTTRLDTLAYGRDTCGGAKTCRFAQVKVHALGAANGLLTSSAPIISPNSSRIIASGRINSNTTYPTTETLMDLVAAPDQGSLVIPAGFFKANSVRQATLTLRLGVNHRYTSSSLLIYARAGGTPGGASFDGVLLGSCAIDLAAVTSGYSNKSADATVTLWIGTRLAGSDNAVPLRSHMNWTYNFLQYTASAPAQPVIPSGAGGHEVSGSVIDGTVDQPIYLSYKWEAPVAVRGGVYIPTDGTEWAFGGNDQILLPQRDGAVGFLRVARPYTSGGQSIYAMGAHPGTVIGAGSSGIIRKTAGGRDAWLPRPTTQTTNVWRACFYAAWLGTRGRWVLVGDGGSIATSDDDGDTWTARTSGTTDKLNCVGGTAAGGLQIGTDNAGGVHLTSADGITWATVSDLASTGRLTGFAVNGTTFVFTGVSGKIAYSTNSGSTWTQKGSGVGATSFISCAYDATIGRFFAATAANVYSATDPSTASWTLTTGLTSSAIAGIVCGAGKCITYGTDGLFHQTTNGTSFTEQTTTQAGSGTFWGDFYEFRL